MSDDHLRITVEAYRHENDPRAALIARTEIVSLALAMFDEAVRHYPNRIVMVRDRARVIKRSDRAD
jgi:hypothetical protein